MTPLEMLKSGMLEYVDVPTCDHVKDEKGQIVYAAYLESENENELYEAVWYVPSGMDSRTFECDLSSPDELKKIDRWVSDDTF